MPVIVRNQELQAVSTFTSLFVDGGELNITCETHVYITHVQWDLREGLKVKMREGLKVKILVDLAF